MYIKIKVFAKNYLKYNGSYSLAINAKIKKIYNEIFAIYPRTPLKKVAERPSPKRRSFEMLVQTQSKKAEHFLV
jgi:hypothetical protein